jgi:PAS domain S-box-containing protein
LLDRQLRFLAVNTLFAEIQGTSAQAHLGQALAALAPRLAAVLAPHLSRLIAEGEPVTGREIDATQPAQNGEAPPRRVLLCGFHPVLGDKGEVVAISGSMLDITARKRAEEAERLLSREVDHRAKNVLAVVRSLVRISAAEARLSPESCKAASMHKRSMASVASRTRSLSGTRPINSVSCSTDRVACAPAWRGSATRAPISRIAKPKTSCPACVTVTAEISTSTRAPIAPRSVVL